MYKITIPSGETLTTEKPTFIRVHNNNCFIICDRAKAEGVIYGGVPYFFKDGVMVHEFDGGSINDILSVMLGVE